MIRLTIYRIGSTIELNLDMLGELRSSEIYTYGLVDPKTGLREDIRYRPYYRRTYDGILNIFAEEELSNGKV